MIPLMHRLFGGIFKLKRYTDGKAMFALHSIFLLRGA